MTGTFFAFENRYRNRIIQCHFQSVNGLHVYDTAFDPCKTTSYQKNGIYHIISKGFDSNCRGCFFGMICQNMYRLIQLIYVPFVITLVTFSQLENV